MNKQNATDILISVFPDRNIKGILLWTQRRTALRLEQESTALGILTRQKLTMGVWEQLSASSVEKKGKIVCLCAAIVMHASILFFEMPWTGTREAIQSHTP